MIPDPPTPKPPPEKPELPPFPVTDDVVVKKKVVHRLAWAALFIAIGFITAISGFVYQYSLLHDDFAASQTTSRCRSAALAAELADLSALVGGVGQRSIDVNKVSAKELQAIIVRLNESVEAYNNAVQHGCPDK